MTLHTSQLRRQAQAALEKASYSPRRLVLIHTAVSLGASLLITFINFLFSKQIAGTGGLSGLGTRSVLETAQAMLELAVMVLLPFWNVGLIAGVVRWVKGEEANFSTLLEGFRRFGTLLAQKLMLGAVLLARGMALSYLCATVFLLSPFSGELTAALAPIMEESAVSSNAQISEEALAQVSQAVTPLLVMFGIVFGVASIPVLYRVRFAEYFVMEDNRALASLLQSVRITRHSLWQLVKLDLSFWWFYLLQGLSVALCYGDTLLKAVGISLPMSADGSYFLFYVLGVVCQGILLWLFQAKVSATYGVAYQTLCAAPAPQPVQPQNVPWDN